MGKILLLISALGSPAVMAHAGHVADESVHGVLHLEHLIILLAIGVAVFLVKRMSRK